MNNPTAKRILELGEYLFAELDRLKREALDRGVSVVDLGVGDPVEPTPDHIIEALDRAARNPENHQYPPYAGKKSLREAIARYMKRRFDVEPDPDREVVALIGSKEGIAHLAWALVDPGDTVLVPDPGYPVYADTARFCGGTVVSLKLERSNGFLPDLDGLDLETARKAKLLWLNYPNNPTSARADLGFFQRVIDFAREHDIVVAHDNSYGEMYLEGDPPPSILQANGGRDVAVEFHSLSKTFNMTGWRIGWLCGRSDVVSALSKVKTNVDSGAFGAVQDAAEAALNGSWESVEQLRVLYRKRRDLLVAALRKAGWDVIIPEATFYVLAATASGQTSMETAGRLLAEAGIVCTPATGFGPGGEGFVRFSLTASDERIEEACLRLEELAAGRR